MATLTLSTDGVRHLIGEEPTECHKADGVEYVRHYGDRQAQTVKLALDPHQALGIAYDLLYQAVDAGIITGWNVQHADA